MKPISQSGIRNLGILLACALASASLGAAAAPPPDSPDALNAPASAPAGPAPSILQWAPPALAALGSQVLANESFTLDRSMLAVTAGWLDGGDPEVQRSVSRLDGVSVHLLRFAPNSAADPAALDSIRDSYHLQGWKHIVSRKNRNDPEHGSSTDVWLELDGVNIRAAVVMVESPRSLTLATMAGNLSPLDLLHLRGHFGIPRFDDDSLNGVKGR